MPVYLPVLTAPTTPGVDCPADIETQDGDLVCQSCAPLEHTRCGGCAQWYRNSGGCRDCVTCDRCETTVAEDDTIETVRGSTICDDCRQDHYWQCTVCDGWNRDGARCGNGCCDPDGCTCEECRSDTTSDLLYDYDYKPAPVFHGTGPLFLGPEIEVETPYPRTEECIEIANSYLGSLGYLKSDGSLTNGFEIVTHPMSYDWAIAHFPWAMLTRLAESGCTVTDGTGLHVHVSREAFRSACHIYRWMVFIHRNQQQVTALAGRSCATWAAFTAADRKAVKDYAKGARGVERYRAINTSNHDTFELRVFASSLDPDDVKAALGFAAASIEYTSELTVPAIAAAGAWNWSAFVTWLAQQPAYAPLTRKLEDLACVC